MSTRHPVHEPGHVGARFPKVDGAGKADGSGIYADDIKLPRMLYAKILRSPHANARIRSVDVSEAEKYPGVVATLVGAEMPEKYGVIPWTHDEQALATDHVRFVGDEVACVAAEVIRSRRYCETVVFSELSRTTITTVLANREKCMAAWPAELPPPTM